MSDTTHIDFHNHLIPAVDDGAVDETESASALEAFAAQHVSTIVATPHVQGSLGPEPMRARLAEIDDGWQRLLSIAASCATGMTLFRGAEVMLDTPRPELDDERLRLAGGRFVLVEFPFMTVPPNSHIVIRSIVNDGLVPIVAHPERYAGLTVDSPLPHHWKDSGALLQINAGSLTGRYGNQARMNAMSLLEQGLPDYMCSDYHARGRPSTGSARSLLVGFGATELGDLLTDVNPRRMLADEMPIPVPPLRRRKGLLGRLAKWLR